MVLNKDNQTVMSRNTTEGFGFAIRDAIVVERKRHRDM